MYYVRDINSTVGTCSGGGSVPCLGATSVSIGGGTYPAIEDGPIVDSTVQKVFFEANGATYATLAQADTALGTVVTATMGRNTANGGSGFGLPTVYNGALDNSWYSSPPGAKTGYMYFCGNQASTSGGNQIATLWRIGFDLTGKMNAANDGNSFALSSSAGGGEDCAPLTEFYNSTTGTDWLFVNDQDNGQNGPISACKPGSLVECLMSFDITPGSFPSFPFASYGSISNTGFTGMVVDNYSSDPGESQIYTIDSGTLAGIQLSQRGLN
jgi:hypothetical protein